MKRWRRRGGIGVHLGCGVVPFNLLLVNNFGDLTLDWEATADPAGWSLELLHPAETQTVIISTGLAGDQRQIIVPVPEEGTFQWRLRDSSSGEACWVYSNTITV